jgi:hypothetical protein
MLHALFREIRDLDSSPQHLRSFGLVVGFAIVVLSFFFAWISGSSALLVDGSPRPLSLLLATGVALCFVAWGAPRALRPLYYAWMTLALILGMVMTRVILTIVFVFLILPIGALMRVLGRDPLQRNQESPADTYWISREDMDRSQERLEKYY